jgi:hypothetical protein
MSRDTTRYPKIELLIFANCPLADAARASLMQALAELSSATYAGSGPRAEPSDNRRRYP